MPAFQVKLGTNDLNCVGVSLNPTHSLTHYFQKFIFGDPARSGVTLEKLKVVVVVVASLPRLVL